MKVLFIASGNSENFEISPFIKSQAESISELGHEVKIFALKGKGILGYIKNITKLKQYFRHNAIDIVHAHYTLSGWVAVLASPKKPIVLSLMGCDAYGDYIGPNKIKFSSNYLIFLTLIIQPFINAIISKSKNLEHNVFLKKKSYIIPNGILLDKITIQSNIKSESLGLNSNMKYVLFLGNKKDIRKNFKLVDEAVKFLNSNNISILSPYPISQQEVVKYLNFVDVLAVPSFMEGSPNIVKEAMACNCPVVATDVGDICWLFGDEPGYYIAGFSPEDFAGKIKSALEFSSSVGRTNGRKRIISLGLDSKVIAQKIIEVYHKVKNS